MKLENTRESVLEAKKLLGIPEDQPIGFIRRGDPPEYEPMIEHAGVTYLVGDEVPNAQR